MYVALFVVFIDNLLIQKCRVYFHILAVRNCACCLFCEVYITYSAL